MFSRWGQWASDLLETLRFIRMELKRIANATEAIAQGPPIDQRSVAWKPGTLVEDTQA